MATLQANVSVVTLFEDDLDEARDFYQRVFGQEMLFEDPDSVLFKFGGTFLNLLKRAAAREALTPGPVADRTAGARCQLTIFVDDVDARCEHLRATGAELLNGPMNRPWGMRTASFRDPSGHIWEIAGPVLGDRPGQAVVRSRGPER